ETAEDAMSDILEIFSQINRDLLAEEDMGRVLERLMDAAMRLAGAESGFLVLRSHVSEGPFPGFEVAVARNMTKEDLQTDLYAFSLSAVKRALALGEPVVTDNALEDVRFKDAKSVHLRKLKSIAALPVRGPEGPIGVFYLDHRFEPGLFEGNVLSALKTFADLAGLALQKARMIQSLKTANAALSEKVEDQAGRVELLERELKESRAVLKNQYEEIIGRSPKMIEALSLVDRITESKIPVWIYGESGTGKEAIARSLHFNGSRAKAPFVTENCGALPENLLESELFGHKKGAFTHAVADKKGILEYVNGGTIFLDEIADMSLNLQVKLLRFLQEGEFRPLGGHQVVKVDVRVVSASNKDLHDLVAQGRFREDLFFRLNGVTVALPPLRERLEDLPLLAEHFLKKIAERERKMPVALHPEALTVLLKYGWPGNIRELQNTLETAVLFAEKGTIGPKSLRFKPALFGGKALAKPAGPVSGETPASLDPDMIRVLAAIRDSGYHKGNAAKALGISRRYLYFKLERHGIPPQTGPLKAYIETRLP
ncbi:MAG TPA: sigma-54-dependent Fis family transcriptional regulator, partial [bacterium]|nr:sigma-54-dependent Fis family transcriptional regulator [bacterium]